MGFFKIFALELASNIPVWLGFMAAIKILHESKSRWWQSILVLYSSAVITATLVLLAEPVKLGGTEPGPIYIDQVLLMAAVFTVVGLPFLWYIGASIRWFTWRTDLILAALLGIILTTGEALVVQIFDPRILAMHAVSMSVAAGVTIPTMRWLKSQPWRVALGGLTAVVIFASLLIVSIEYVPQPKLIGSTNTTTSQSK